MSICICANCFRPSAWSTRIEFPPVSTSPCSAWFSSSYVLPPFISGCSRHHPPLLPSKGTLHLSLASAASKGNVKSYDTAPRLTFLKCFWHPGWQAKCFGGIFICSSQQLCVSGKYQVALKKFNGRQFSQGIFTEVRAGLENQQGMVRHPWNSNNGKPLAPEAWRIRGGNSLVRTGVAEGGPFAKNAATCTAWAWWECVWMWCRLTEPRSRRKDSLHSQVLAVVPFYSENSME